MVARILKVLATAAKWSVSDFVVNVMMGWPGSVGECISRANLYLRAGATVVTIIRRLPCVELPLRAIRRVVTEINGPVGVLLKMPVDTYIKFQSVARLGVARIGYGNQWPHHIRTMLQKSVELQRTG